MGRYSSPQEAVKSITKAMTQSLNEDEFNPNLGDIRYKSEGTIFIFSTAKRDFEVSQPLFPRLTLAGCTKGERYVLAATVPDPVPQASPDLERGGRRMDSHNGWTCAIGLLYPVAEAAFGIEKTNGTNLIAQGLFPSLVNPPIESDIRAAESFRDRRYKRLTDQAFRAAAKSSKALSDFLHQHEDIGDAMDAQRLTADWHRKRDVLAKCPNCGDDIPASVAFHKSSVGVLCVLDPERAFKAGAIDRARYEDLVTSPA